MVTFKIIISEASVGHHHIPLMPPLSEMVTESRDCLALKAWAL